ncbi:RNase adapter RapZ [Acidiphilium sp.]|jgi:UPF0042 nucleotide-binding protein|uniref:RNase adapter RapZ n=1 Tax=Acidiphilium TaxID=522 RepID=UPI00258DA855|nr:RNase adapter RapZ [Acidiphilium sp.]
MSARMVIVTGLSGAGRNSVLRALEDIGYEAVDNPPLRIVETLVRGDKPLAVGVDARTRDFSAEDVLSTIDRLQIRGCVRPELIFITASPEALQRRFSETRRRHPLALAGTVSEGIETEQALTRTLRNAADWVIDTSELSLAGLRQIIDQRFGLGGPGMSITLVSFGYPSGLPQEADLVLDTRFLRNPHYIPDLRDRTGLDPEVRDYIRQDPDFPEFFERVSGLTDYLLPRFVREGKKYVMIAFGCTGGKHRSVSLVEMLGSRLRNADWNVLIEHRSLGSRSAGGAWKAMPGAHQGAPMPGVQK